MLNSECLLTMSTTRFKSASISGKNTSTESCQPMRAQILTKKRTESSENSLISFEKEPKKLRSELRACSEDELEEKSSLRMKREPFGMKIEMRNRLRNLTNRSANKPD